MARARRTSFLTSVACFVAAWVSGSSSWDWASGPRWEDEDWDRWRRRGGSGDAVPEGEASREMASDRRFNVRGILSIRFAKENSLVCVD